MFNKRGLRKCECGEFPEVISGEHKLTKEVKYSICCRNPKCPTQPSTDRGPTFRIVKKAWNKGMTTEAILKAT